MRVTKPHSKTQVTSGLGSILILLGSTLVGCKASPTTPVNPVHIENVSVNTTTAANQDALVNFSITLSTGNFTVAAINLPVLDPKTPSTQYGTLSLAPVFCSTPSTCPYGNGVQIGVNLDLTAILKTKGVAPLLPNGAALPVGGLQNSAVIALPVGNTGAEIYFAFGQGVAMLGTAVPFAQMNSVGQAIPGANLFIPVTVSTPQGSFSLLPGLFTGRATNTTGVGFFADLSGIIPKNMILASLSDHTSHRAVTSTAVELRHSNTPHAEPEKSRLVFPATYPSTVKRNHLYQELINLNSRGGYLNLQ